MLEHPIAPPAPLRVAAVPSAHPYVRNLGLGAFATLLDDPRPPGAEPGRWWPPVMLDPGWIARHAPTFDLLHVHFGTEGLDVEQLHGTAAALRAAGRPLVVTVHDLEHPQLAGPGAHDEHLDVLVGHADAVITLTRGAAAEIHRRHARAAVVVPHPHVLALDAPRPLGTPGRELVAGVHLRDLRPNIDGPGAVRTLAAAIVRLRADGVPARGAVALHDAVRDRAARDEVRRLCAAAGDALTLREAPRPDDAALARELAALDVCVLPYTHGTHSGWVELCWDLGVPVVGPAVGFVAEQHPDPGFLRPVPAGDAAGLAGAIRAPGGAPRGSTARRARQASALAQRRRLVPRSAAAHRAVYARALGAPGGAR